MILQIENITKSFGANIILEDLSVRILANARYSLIGANGIGKTTLLRLINKSISPDSGRIIYSKNTKIGFLKQDSGLDHNNNVYDEMKSVFKELLDIQNKLKIILKELSDVEETSSIYQEKASEYSKLQNYFEVNDGYNIDTRIDIILNGMGFDKTRYTSAINMLSGGEKTRLAMAKILLEEPNLLILDEPTNHLDFKTLTWLEKYLSEYKHTILVVSHDRYFLDKVTDHTLDLTHKGIISYKGNYSRYLVLKEEQYKKHVKDYAAQQEEIAKLEEYIAKNLARASTTKMAQSRRKKLEKMERIPPPIKTEKKIKLNFRTKAQPYLDVLRVEDIDISVGDNNEIKLCKNISMNIRRGDKIALVGTNGVGKSTFINIIQNLHKHFDGKISWGEGVKIGCFEQETRDLNPDKLVIDELWDRFKHINELEIRNTLASVSLVGEDVYKKVNVLSGGEKAKIKFCILSLQPSNVLIMDEPTNHLDLNAKSVLEDALEDYGGTLLFISHDRYLLNIVPDKIIEITPTGAIEYIGKYDDYMETKALADENILVDIEVEEEKSVSTYRSKDQRREEAEQRKKLQEFEKNIEETEKSIKNIEEEMLKEEVYINYELVHKLSEELEAEKNKLDKLLEKWSNLE